MDFRILLKTLYSDVNVMSGWKNRSDTKRKGNKKMEIFCRKTPDTPNLIMKVTSNLKD